ncbi:TonB-dependent receptor domain-containing protein [Laribacter hongkongensis]|uniref:Putative outer membrane receptor protein n=2 Tax=Laribacter hongkongensis TaxID=168471 RepID=A0A248LPR2_9NEIS|nr:TonB-dependent receptor [Laribacter hongkongensis]ASJ26286.1 putative outer membrane receptor protein [Laribacter hongkongensis]MCG9040749.1 TonB-dependent receptor [Laribacter hongkongensis]MCG9068079.1 TonB-dependent receptor [Laribacter hongkongensis]MCG9088870.1 TonB-dependent receptor [Laribacter hongkongensis]MCG9110232.1 TonB-dependent receptor [Laribacter hongkongensis]
MSQSVFRFVASSVSLAIGSAFAAAPATEVAETVVTATRTPVQAASLTRDVSVITRDDIARAGPTSLPELLSREAGIEFASNGGDGRQSSLFIRGTNSNQSVVLIDGVRVVSATTGATALEQIPLEQIECIEIVRGPVSGLYGADAIGGVVQVFTRKGRGAPAPHLSLAAGNDGTWRVGAGIGGVVGDTSFAVDVTHRTTDGGFSATNRDNFNYNPDEDGYRNTAYSVRVSHLLAEGHEVGFNAFQAFGRAQYDANQDLTGQINDIQKNRVQANSVYLKNQLTERWHSTLTLSQAVDRSENFTPRNPWGPDYGRFKTTQDTLTWQNDLALGAAGQLTAGYEHQKQKVSSTQEFTVSNRQNNAVFAGWNGEFGASLLNASLRHDNNSQFGGKTTGTLGYGYRVNEAVKLTANWGTAFRVPTFNDLYWPDDGNGYVGNPNLKPESSRNAEVGAELSGALGKLKLAAFENRVDDLINGYDCSGGFPCTSSNVNKATIKGVSLTGSTVLAGTTLRGNVNWQDPRDDITDKRLTYRSEWYGTLDVSRPFDQLTLGSTLRVAGSRYADSGNTKELGGYALVDLYADYALNPTTRLFARVNNAFDRDYTQLAGYNTAGREWLVGVNWQPK